RLARRQAVTGGVRSGGGPLCSCRHPTGRHHAVPSTTASDRGRDSAPAPLRAGADARPQSRRRSGTGLSRARAGGLGAAAERTITATLAVRHPAQYLAQPHASRRQPARPHAAGGDGCRAGGERRPEGAARTARHGHRARPAAGGTARRAAAGGAGGAGLRRGGPHTGRSGGDGDVAAVAGARAAARADGRPAAAVRHASEEGEVTRHSASPVSEADLHAYVDDRLPPVRRADVEAWLVTHPDEAARVTAWQRQADDLRVHFEPELAMAAPAAMAALFDARQRRDAMLRRVMQVAAVLLIAVTGAGIGWWSRGYVEPPRIPALPAEAARAHLIYTREVLHPVEVTAAEE